MTSEGYPVSPDRAHMDGYGEAAQDGRGYGVFEPPPAAPEEFPVFTPGAPSPFPVFGAEDSAPADSPGSFGGFPPETGSSQPPAYETPSYETPAYDAPAYGAPSYETPGYGAPSSGSPSSGTPSDVYVPAPAIVPLPNQSADPAAWSSPSYLDSAEQQPYGSEPAYPPAHGDSQPAGPAWQSFAPAGPPPAGPPPPAAASPPGYGYDIPEARSTGWSPFGGGGNGPTSGGPGGDYASEEPREYTSVFDEPEAASAPAPAPAPQPTYGAYGTPAAEPYPPAAFPAVAPPPEPVPAPPAPAQPAPAQPGTVAKASVPVASRVSPPTDGVPGAPPRSGRVYGSAQPPVPPGYAEQSGPMQPGVVDPPSGTTYGSQTYGQQPQPQPYGTNGSGYSGLAAGQDGQAAHNGYHPGQTGTAAPAQPAPQNPAQAPGAPAAGAASARASVSVGRVTPTDAPPPPPPPPPAQPGQPGGPAQPGQATVYGRPAQPTVYGAPAGAPGSPAGAGHPQAPGYSTGQVGSAPPQAPQRPADGGTTRGPGMPAYSDLLGPAQPASAPVAAPAKQSIPAQRAPQSASDPDQGRLDSFKPDAEPPASGKGGTAKVLVMVIGACLLLIGLAFGALIAVGKLVGGGDALAVGQCVKRQDNTAVVVDCGTADSFKITKKVTTQQDCPNPQNDALTQGSDIFCLEPTKPE